MLYPMARRPGYYHYIRGEVRRFDHRYTVFARARWDTTLVERRLMQERIAQAKMERDIEGFRRVEQALRAASWYVEHGFGGSAGGIGRKGLYSWSSHDPSNGRLQVEKACLTPEAAKVKYASLLFGADLVGVCRLNRSWLYSRVYDWDKGESIDVDALIPEDYRYAVVLALEMNYDALKTSPSAIAGSAVGVGYSYMPVVASMLAEFIRCLGYRAIPLGNDTALSVPLALDAGLGELGRNGLLITPEYGPRVRLCKVLTDMPLKEDEPIEFGVQAFCEVCKKCAERCPSHAISSGARSEWVDELSNSRGVLKWPVDPVKCYTFWCANGVDCAICITVCPFNKPNTLIHRATRWFVKHTPILDRLLVRLDDILGYGRQMNAEEFWSKIRIKLLIQH